MYVARDINKIGQYIYSYPLNTYIGAATYSEDIISLFFERKKLILSVNKVITSISINRN